MAHQIQNLVGEDAIHEGDSFELTVPVTDDGTAGGTPTNLTGLVAATYAIDTPGGVRKITKTLGSGVTVPAPATDGIMKIVVDPADTQEIPGVYVHALRIEDSANKKLTVLTGDIEITDTFLTALE